MQQSKVEIYCRLQDLMDERGITRTGLAETTGLTYAAIRGLCENTTKRFDKDTLAALCGYFECGIEDLFEVVPKESEEAGNDDDIGAIADNDQPPEADISH